MTDSDRSRNAKTVFNEALEIPSHEREAFLARRCASDDDLRNEVRELLRFAAEESDSVDGASPEAERLPRRVGKYELTELIGRGGMGRVYRATDTRLGRAVAVKGLSSELARDPVALDRLEREARFLAQFTHPNIASVYDFEVEEGWPFVTMEFVSGETLADRIARNSSTVDEQRGIAAQLAGALAAAHANGIVHRDLKPLNVMIGEDGQVKVLDFGIAKSLGGLREPGASVSVSSSSSSTLAGTVMGTPGYMSPEQWAGEQVTDATDMWALGCILWELVVGRPAIAVEDLPTGPGNGRFPAPDWSLLPRGVPRSVRTVLRRCLVEDPGVRISAQAAHELLANPGWSERVGGRTFFALGAVAVGIAIILVLALGARDRGPYVFRLDGHSVQALRSDGSLAWVKMFEGEPHRNRSPYAGRFPPTTLAGDQGQIGVVVPVRTSSSTTELVLLGSGTGEVLWARPVAWEQVPREAEGPWTVWWTRPLASGPNPTAAIGIRNDGYYQFGVQRMNADGEVLGTYCHPGIVDLAAREDFNGDGEVSLLLFGDNSSARFDRRVVEFDSPDSHCGVVAILAEEELRGQAFPYSRYEPEHRDWPGMPHAREDYYLVIPPILPSYPTRVSDVMVKEEGFEAELTDGRVFVLDLELRPEQCLLPLGSEARRLHDSGEVLNPRVLRLVEGVEELMEIPVDTI